MDTYTGNVQDTADTQSIESRLGRARSPRDIAALAEMLLSCNTYVQRIGDRHYASPRHYSAGLLGKIDEPTVTATEEEGGVRLHVRTESRSACVQLPGGEVVSGHLHERDLGRIRLLARNREAMARAMGRLEQAA